MGIDFKLADLHDRELILEMMLIYYEYDHLDFDLDRATKALTQLIENSDFGRIWLIQNTAKEVVGYVVMMNLFSLEYGGKVGLIDELFVIDEFRGQGIGSGAISRVFSEAKSIGLHSVRLEVTKSNDQALRLYQKLGFKDIGRSLLNCPLG